MITRSGSHRGGGRSRTSGSPGLQEFDIKLIDTVDLEGGPPGIIEPRTLSKLVMCNPLV